jgi:hypothetical protein
MMRYAIFLGVCALSCEHDPRREPSISAPLHATAPKPAVSSIDRAPRVVEPPPPAPVTSPEPAPPPPPPARAHVRERVPTADELPSDPPTKRSEYAAWLRRRTRAEQHQIALFCRANPLEVEHVCGGIGPLHVPRPPSIRAALRATNSTDVVITDPDDVDFSPSVERAEWFNAMSSAQQHWVTATCDEYQNQGDLCTTMTPLVVSFDGAPIEYTQGTRFAFEGTPTATDWPTAATPWLALDRNGDGAITSGAELFGNHTVLPDGSVARDGFEALAALDANHDGRIDKDDPAFARLVLWADRDRDGRSSPDELAPASATLVSISLAAQPVHDCDARDNCAGLVATLRWRDGRGIEHTGKVVDVYLPFR